MRVTATQKFRRNLAREMKSRDLTQREFATMAKVTYPYVNRILTGKSFRPSLDMVEQFAKALGMQVADLIA